LIIFNNINLVYILFLQTYSLIFFNIIIIFLLHFIRFIWFRKTYIRAKPTIYSIRITFKNTTFYRKSFRRLRCLLFLFFLWTFSLWGFSDFLIRKIWFNLCSVWSVNKSFLIIYPMMNYSTFFIFNKLLLLYFYRWPGL